MGPFRKLLCTLAALLPAVTLDTRAEAGAWTRYDMQDGRASVEVDFNSLTITGNVRRVAVRTIWSQPVVTKDKLSFDFGTSLQDHNCLTGESRFVTAEYFLKGEKVAITRTSSNWRKAAASDRAHKDICAAAPPNAAQLR